MDIQELGDFKDIVSLIKDLDNKTPSELGDLSQCNINNLVRLASAFKEAQDDVPDEVMTAIDELAVVIAAMEIKDMDIDLFGSEENYQVTSLIQKAYQQSGKFVHSYLDYDKLISPPAL